MVKKVLLRNIQDNAHLKLTSEQALVIANIPEEGYQEILDSVVGIMFLDTLHHGSETTSSPFKSSNIFKMASTFGVTKTARKDVPNSLERNAPELQLLQEEFQKLIDFRIISSFDNAICKYKGPTCADFKVVWNVLKGLADGVKG